MPSNSVIVNQAARLKYRTNPDNQEKIRASQARYHSANREKYLASSKRWYLKNRDRVKNSWLKRLYRITLQQYNELLAKQNNACAICEVPTKLHVDHDHKTGRVRGLLCSDCNLGLGKFVDSAIRLESAASYLRR